MNSKGAAPDSLKESIRAARGEAPPTLVIKGARFLDVFSGQFREGDIAVLGETIVGMGESYDGPNVMDGSGFTVVPGFIDAHVHIESSMLVPRRFQQAVLPEGTTCAIWDPHEIANVKGVKGIEWALDSTEDLDLDVFVMVPSCVPSTSPSCDLETSGATLGVDDVVPFKKHPRVLGLAEMMNFPGLLGEDEDVLAKLSAFADKKRDGHCPSLSGKDLNAYAVAGIHSCHESTGLDEAREKMSKGIHVLIREGSCAKDADTLLPILDAYSSAVCGFCSDDRNPLDIEDEGHISCIVERALRAGHDPASVFRAASFAPARIYGLEDRGAIAPGYLADLCLVKPRTKGTWQDGCEVIEVVKSGKLVSRQQLAEEADRHLKGDVQGLSGPNIRMAQRVSLDQLRIEATPSAQSEKVRAIGVRPGQILTDHLTVELKPQDGCLHPDLANDLQKIAVFERHHASGHHTVGFVRGFSLTTGAIASSINHDSHNIICVGATDQAMVDAIDKLCELDGGIVVTDGKGGFSTLQLPIGGLMTETTPNAVTESLRDLKKLARSIGCSLEEPFLQMSFLALPVIPSLKITDRGLVDVEAFQKVSVQLATPN